jgi:hypothetical protein
MTDEPAVPPPPPPEPQGIQFDRAESRQPAEPALACAGCRNPLVEVYYLLQGAKVCASCRDGVQQALTAGSPLKRFLKAFGLGSLAAIVGAIVYLVVAIWVQIGFIAIFVGWFVGVAVRKGSEGRGGGGYQALAMALTYSAIVVTYVPFAMERQLDAMRHEKAAAAEKAKEGGAPAKAEDRRPVTNPLFYGVLLVFVFVMSCAEPFRQGPENFIGLLLIGIALFEAWKINKRVSIDFKGPFQLGAAPEKSAGG